jgi:hypothetical protein
MTDDTERRLNRLEGQYESLEVFLPQFLRAMREDNQAFRQEVREDLRAMREDNRAFRQEVREDLQTMEAKMEAKVEAMEAKAEAMEAKADASRREARLIGLGLAGLIIALFTLTASMIALIAN